VSGFMSNARNALAREGLPATEAALRHVAGGSMSGARGVRSSDAPVVSQRRTFQAEVGHSFRGDGSLNRIRLREGFRNRNPGLLGSPGSRHARKLIAG